MAPLLKTLILAGLALSVIGPAAAQAPPILGGPPALPPARQPAYQPPMMGSYPAATVRYWAPAPSRPYRGTPALPGQSWAPRPNILQQQRARWQAAQAQWTRMQTTRPNFSTYRPRR